MYEVVISLKSIIVCCCRFKSITHVCKFLETVNFDLVTVDVMSPKFHHLDPIALLEVWNA